MFVRFVKTAVSINHLTHFNLRDTNTTIIYTFDEQRRR